MEPLLLESEATQVPHDSELAARTYVVTWLTAKTDSNVAPAYYVVVAAVVSLLTILTIRGSGTFEPDAGELPGHLGVERVVEEQISEHGRNR